MNEVDILRYLVGALLTVSGVIGGALIAVLVWIGKLVLKRIGELGTKMESFDKRVLRLELRQQLRPVARSRAGDV